MLFVSPFLWGTSECNELSLRFLAFLVKISFLLSLKNKLMEATMVRWHLVVLFLSESYLYRCYRLRLPISDTVTQELVNLKTFWIDKKIFYTRVSLGSVSNSWR